MTEFDMYITYLRGSWNRDELIGYKVVHIPFSKTTWMHSNDGICKTHKKSFKGSSCCIDGKPDKTKAVCKDLFATYSSECGCPADRSVFLPDGITEYRDTKTHTTQFENIAAKIENFFGRDEWKQNPDRSERFRPAGVTMGVNGEVFISYGTDNTFGGILAIY